MTGAVGAFGSVSNVRYHVFEFYYVAAIGTTDRWPDISPCELSTLYNDDKHRPSAHKSCLVAILTY